MGCVELGCSALQPAHWPGQPHASRAQGLDAEGEGVPIPLQLAGRAAAACMAGQTCSRRRLQASGLAGLVCLASGTGQPCRLLLAAADQLDHYPPPRQREGGPLPCILGQCTCSARPWRCWLDRPAAVNGSLHGWPDLQLGESAANGLCATSSGCAQVTPGRDRPTVQASDAALEYAERPALSPPCHYMLRRVDATMVQELTSMHLLQAGLQQVHTACTAAACVACSDAGLTESAAVRCAVSSGTPLDAPPGPAWPLLAAWSALGVGAPSTAAAASPEAAPEAASGTGGSARAASGDAAGSVGWSGCKAGAGLAGTGASCLGKQPSTLMKGAYSCARHQAPVSVSLSAAPGPAACSG